MRPGNAGEPGRTRDEERVALRRRHGIRVVSAGSVVGGREPRDDVVERVTDLHVVVERWAGVVAVVIRIVASAVALDAPG